MKILLANSYELAKNISGIHATVEAEYGDTVIKGTKFTFAHHSKDYKNFPAPCEMENIEEFDGDILISHIDLDTIGGCLALYNKKPEDKNFWKEIGYLDVNGPHHIHELPPDVQKKITAYWAYNSTHIKEKHIGVCDVTDEILQSGKILQKIVDNDEEMLYNGIIWKEETEKRVENNLKRENNNVRCFETEDVFCSSSYYSPKLEKIIPAIVVLNKKMNCVTISFADGGKKYNAAIIAKYLWGDLAGGHDGIAGSPRGWNITYDELKTEFDRAADYVENCIHSNKNHKESEE
jgi:hypothetical protein